MSVQKLQPNNEYEIYVINPWKTKFGDTFVLFDRVHKKHFSATTKISKYIRDNKLDEIWEDGTCLFKIKTGENKSFMKDGKKITYLDLKIYK